MTSGLDMISNTNYTIYSKTCCSDHLSIKTTVLKSFNFIFQQKISLNRTSIETNFCELSLYKGFTVLKKRL